VTSRAPAGVSKPGRSRARRAAFAFLVVLACASGCARERASEPATLEASSAAGQLLGPDSRFTRTSLFAPTRRLFPLAEGNEWEYTIHTSNTVVTDSGPQPQEAHDQPWVAEIDGTQQRGEQTYFRLEEYDPRAVIRPYVILTLLRQDASGLFVDDLAGFVASERVAASGGGVSGALARSLRDYVDRTPATAARREAFRRAADRTAEKLESIALGAGRAAGPDANELSFLRYPLFVGAHWIVRTSPLFERAVVARERVRLPGGGSAAAWRLRGTSELFDAEDRVSYWYGALGLVRLSVRLVTIAVDDNGGIIGRFVYESDQVLTAARLGGSGPARGSNAGQDAPGGGE